MISASMGVGGARRGRLIVIAQVAEDFEPCAQLFTQLRVGDGARGIDSIIMGGLAGSNARY